MAVRATCNTCKPSISVSSPPVLFLFLGRLHYCLWVLFVLLQFLFLFLKHFHYCLTTLFLPFSPPEAVFRNTELLQLLKELLHFKLLEFCVWALLLLLQFLFFSYRSSFTFVSELWLFSLMLPFSSNNCFTLVSCSVLSPVYFSLPRYVLPFLSQSKNLESTRSH